MEDRNIRDELLAHDRIDPHIEAELARRVNGMMEIELIPSYRKGWIVSGIICLLVGIYYVVLAAYCWNEFQWPARIATVSLAAGSLVWTALSASIVRRNRVVRAIHMPWGITVITMLAYVLFIMSFLQAGLMKNQMMGIMILFGGMSVLIAAAVVIVLFRIEQSSVKMQEELLRIQLQIADMGGKQKADKGE